MHVIGIIFRFVFFFVGIAATAYWVLGTAYSAVTLIFPMVKNLLACKNISSERDVDDGKYSPSYIDAEFEVIDEY